MENKVKWMIGGGVLAVILFGIVIFFTSINRVKSNDTAGSAYSRADLSNIEEGGDDSQNYWAGGNHNFAKGEGGYYYLQLESMNLYLMYFDDEIKSTIPVCGKADCNHKNTECNAYFKMGEYFTNTVYYYKGYVYLCKYEEGMGVLMQISPDGASRKKIAELMPNDKVNSIDLVFQDDYIYYYDRIGHTGDDTEQKEIIKRVSLDGQNPETVFEYTGVGAAINYGKSYGNKLFFIIQVAKVDKKKGQQTMEYKGLFAYDYETGETGLVTEDKVYDYVLDLQHQVLYYFVAGEGLYKKELGSDEKTLLRASTDNLVWGKLSYDGRYLYVDNVGVGSVVIDNTNKIDRMCFVLDRDGNTINTILYDKTIRVNYFGDNEFMFAKKGEEELIYIDKSNIENKAEWKSLSN